MHPFTTPHRSVTTARRNKWGTKREVYISTNLSIWRGVGNLTTTLENLQLCPRSVRVRRSLAVCRPLRTANLGGSLSSPWLGNYVAQLLCRVCSQQRARAKSVCGPPPLYTYKWCLWLYSLFKCLRNIQKSL